MAVYSLTFGFATPKRHILARNHVFSFDVFCVKIRAGVLAVDNFCRTQKTNEQIAE